MAQTRKEKFIEGLKNPSYMMVLILNRLAPYIKNDELFLRLKYFFVFHKKLNLDSPKTYNEKLQWLKIHDKKPEYTNMVDKIEAKKFAASIIGTNYIIPTIAIYEKFSDINFEELPNQFVIKCTHDSGGVAICKDKKYFDKNKARSIINFGLGKSHYPASREYPYKNIKPRIIIEKYMKDSFPSKNEDLTDYKIYCCNGKPICIMTCTDRSKGVKYHFFTPDWKFLRWDHITQYEPEGFTMPCPSNLKEMIEISTKLSAGIPEVRVDLYSVNGRTYFGEMTFFSNSGFDTDLTYEADCILGDCLTLPKNI